MLHPARILYICCNDLQPFKTARLMAHSVRCWQMRLLMINWKT